MKIKLFLLGLFCSAFVSVFAQEKVAVMDFKAGDGVSQNDVLGMTDVFVTYFHPKGYIVLDRGCVLQKMEEKRLKSDVLKDNQLMNIASLLNLSEIVMGNVSFMGNKYSVDVRVVDVKSGGIAYSIGSSFTEKNYRAALKKMAKRIALKMKTSVNQSQNVLVESKNENNNTGGNQNVVEKKENTGDGNQKTAQKSSNENKAGHLVSEQQRRCLERKVTDFDGNIYHTVYIGHQCWTKENMRSTHGRDGKVLQCYAPNDDPSRVTVYGYLYDWYSAKDVCPLGWHLPSDKEWVQMENVVGSEDANICDNSKANSYAKALCSTWGWERSSSECAIGNNPSKNNSTGFEVLPSGLYNSGYFGFGVYTNFWSSTELQSGFAYDHGFNCNNANVIRYVDGKQSGFSVRCVRN